MKKLFSSLAATLTLSSLLALPIATFAQENATTPSPSNSTVVQGQKCADNTIEYSVRMERIHAEQDASLAKRRGDRDAEILAHRSTENIKLANRRGEMDAKIINLQARREMLGHDNAALRPAVEAYIAAVETATKVRWEAIKGAHEIFNKIQDEALKTRRVTIDLAIKTRREAIDTAFNTWKTRCGGTKEERQTANKAFHESINTARKNFQMSREAAFSTFTNTMKPAHVAQEQTLKSTREIFQKALQVAKDTFKQAKIAVKK